MSTHLAIVFDCDGVLVNSEEIAQEIELELLAEHGLHYEREEFCRRFLGVSNVAFRTLLNADSEQQLGVPLPDDFAERLTSRIGAAFRQNLISFDGLSNLVDTWPGAVAVASSSSAQHLINKLEITNIRHHFDPHIYSTDLVGASKPDPAIYLHAAAELGINPAECLAVEDSINGVVSARAAGMRTVGFTAGKHCLDGHDDLLLEAGAELVVESMFELKDWLEQL